MNRFRFSLLTALLAPMLLIAGVLRIVARGANWQICNGITIWFHRTLCAALGVRVRVLGEFPRTPQTLIAANHVSWLDIPVLGGLQSVTFLAKKEVGGHWLGRVLVNLQGVIFVDRKRRRSIPGVNREISAKLAGKAPIVLFAEATTGDGNRLLRFRSSHFEALRAVGDGDEPVLVQPLFITYIARNGLPLGREGQPLAAWYGDMTFMSHLFRFLRDGPFDCEVALAKPIRFFRTSNRKEVALRAQTSVRELAVRQRRTRFQPRGPVAPPEWRPSPERACFDRIWPPTEMCD